MIREDQFIAPGYTFDTVTDQIASVVLKKYTPLFWFGGLGVGLALLFGFLMAVSLLFAKGIGVWLEAAVCKTRAMSLRPSESLGAWLASQARASGLKLSTAAGPG